PAYISILSIVPTTSPTVVINKTPPSLSLNFSPNGSNGWFVANPARGTITATTLGTNKVASLNCKGATITNLSGYGTNSATGTLLVTTQGLTAVKCSATDTFGNISMQQI